MAAKPALPLNVPASNVTVKISAIDSTMTLAANGPESMFDPPIEGWKTYKAGTWSFLIEHPSGRKLLYDLGCRKDWENLPAPLMIKEMMQEGGFGKLDVKKNVSEILTEGGVSLQSIEGIIWSHWHFDHIGDPSTFPGSTKLIVGEGFKKAFLPGYPADPQGHVSESDFKGRELMEIPFGKTDITIGRFAAYDYFGDGSFYILDSPGHAIGHINALARTHASPSSAFIHLGGDSAHHPGEFRPTEYIPIPDSIDPSPAPKKYATACPGHAFNSILRNGSKNEHILEMKDPFKGQVEDEKFGLIVDEAAFRDTIRKDEELDADKDVFTIIAHDWFLKGTLDEWPRDLNSWKEKGLKELTMWKFLEDFEGACH